MLMVIGQAADQTTATQSYICTDYRGTDTRTDINFGVWIKHVPVDVMSALVLVVIISVLILS